LPHSLPVAIDVEIEKKRSRRAAGQWSLRAIERISLNIPRQARGRQCQRDNQWKNSLDTSHENQLYAAILRSGGPAHFATPGRH
jgi:hypothetical protein